MRDNCCSYMLCKNLFDCFSAIQSTAVIAVGGGGGGRGGNSSENICIRGVKFIYIYDKFD